MTVYVHYELSCDQPDCFNAYAPSVEDVGSLRRIRAAAGHAGWTRTRGTDGEGAFDRCPAHRNWHPE